MSKSIECSIDLLKVDKNRIEEREYRNKDNEVVKQKLYKFSVVESQERKFIKEGEGWKMWKTHFISEKRDKDEPKNYIGDGLTFEKEEDVNQKFEEITKSDEINPSDIPF